ncbi:MAG: hypothetical protein OZ928_20945 [Polyangiaceae bacterium]|nr:hypothetical protein [Polyangiaceae bacterium]
MKKGKIRVALLVLATLAYFVLGWVAGLVVALVWIAATIARAYRTARALAPTTRCEWCGATVEQYGRYSCSACGARTLGWAWRCPACGSWAGHQECGRCGLSVRNPSLPKP